MDYITIIKTVVIIIISVIVYVLLLKGVIRDAHLLKSNYIESINRYILKKNADYISDPIRTIHFFSMKNDGDNPCDLKKDITYVDYIGNSDIYMEIKNNDRND